MDDNSDARLAAAPLAPTGPFSVTLAPATRDGRSLLASGQVAVRDGVLIAEGLVGAEVDLVTAQACAWQCARNLLAAVAREIGGLDRIESVVRLGVYVASAPGFTEQHLVAHGASQLVLDVLGERGRHARTAIGVAALPLNSPVEVDALIRLRGADE